ncbi:hypothetical protein Salat_2604300 [Sesamum alatum]|uniref:Uncharacterized protein n=1 Tax=Sesamum alatum TaxID=300844 RepID=A0AAE1XP67_9LAMI|nr:hypothetical protein Salat_2604300 [Sesamum alatum]
MAKIPATAKIPVTAKNPGETSDDTKPVSRTWWTKGSDLLRNVYRRGGCCGMHTDTTDRRGDSNRHDGSQTGAADEIAESEQIWAELEQTRQRSRDAGKTKITDDKQPQINNNKQYRFNNAIQSSNTDSNAATQI